jgi:hypothetical protein
MKRNVWFARERPPEALTIGDFSALSGSAISEDNPTDGHYVEAQERDPIHLGPPSSKVCCGSGSTSFSQMQKLGFQYTGGPAFRTWVKPCNPLLITATLHGHEHIQKICPR